MLSKGKIILMAIVLAILLIVPVSAEDANSTDVALTDDFQVTPETLSTTHTVSGNTFGDIQNAIDNAREGDTIELSGDYIGNGSEIRIDKALNIHGKGKTTLDADKKSSIFSVFSKNTNIANLFILNSSGSAVYSSEIYSFVCLNCTFINNTAKYGGAINLGSAVNCTFIDNSATYGAAMYECTAFNCIFIDNYASNSGGATFDVDAENCNFTNNTANNGGAMAFGDAVNCNFTNNRVSNYGGAIYYGDADRCRFINNSDGSGGWISNYFYQSGDAIYGGTAIRCYFEGNNLPLQIYCNAEFNVTQSGQYYQGKTLTVKLVEIESRLPLGGQKILVNFSNGKSAMLTTDYQGVATYKIPFYAGIYSASVSVDSRYVTVDDVIMDNIVINKVPGTLDIACIGENYGNVTLTFKLTNGDTPFLGENILIRFSNGKSATVTTDSNGVANYSVPFDAGVYSVSASVEGDNVIVSDASLDNIVIKKIPVYLDVIVSGQYQRAVTLVVLDSSFTVPISGEKLEIKFSNGKSATSVTNDMGIATYWIPFSAGSYLLTADILSNRFYAQSKTISVKLLKATPELSASKKTFKLKTKSKKYTISLKDDMSQPMKNVKVTLKVNGKTYNAKTNSKGKATFKITKLKKKGTFKATVRYVGNGYYNSVTKRVKISVK